MAVIRSCIGTFSLAVLSACGGTTAPSAAYVQFRSDAPFCGPFLYTFTIDGKTVGTERLKHDQTSSPYATVAGTHRLSAKLDGIVTPTPDTTVVLRGGETFTRVLPFYCS